MQLILAATLLLFGLSESAFAVEEDAELVMCTMDARGCPDGSYVSRSGPNCEFAPCPSEKPTSSEELIEATITGSAETPDPVLERVLELEKQGTISNVIIMESFPVRIQLKATQQVIDELKALPRIKSPAFQ